MMSWQLQGENVGALKWVQGSNVAYRIATEMANILEKLVSIETCISASKLYLAGLHRTHAYLQILWYHKVKL
jgi:hypothetical protein